MTAERSGFKIRLLGPVHAERDGVELTLGSAHRQAVFAVLARNPNRAVSREELVNAVWGENPPASAVGNIYTYVSALRRVLEPCRDRWASGSVLTSGGGNYCLHVDEQNVDASRFEALRDESRKLRAAGDCAAELATDREALDLWQGTALSGIPGPYAESQRLRLAELHLATVERHAELMLELGRAGEVRAELSDMAAQHPRREHLTGLAMTANARCGRLADAMALYTQLRDRLIEETGTEPGPPLRAVYAGLVADNPEPACPEPVSEPPTRTEESRPADFVGRTEELRILHTALADVAAGRGGSVWIDGTPGSGKSALLDEGLRDARLMGCQVGRGVGDELAQRMPLSVLFECLDSISLMDADDTAGNLVGSLGTAGEMIANPTTAVLEAVQALIMHTCADGPLVLVIDDLQWADETSLLVWHSLHRLIGRLPLLLIAASRPLPASRELHLLRAVLPANGACVLELPPLSDEESRAFLGRRAQLSAEQTDEIVVAAAGNPFYLTHLAAVPRGQLTPGLIAAVTEHLAILTDETRHVLRACAFLGEKCLVTDLPAVTGKPATALVRAVESALEAGLLVVQDIALRLRHPVVRQVLHEAVPTALRVMVHREFAEKIEAAGAGRDRVLGQLIAGPVPVDNWVSDWLAEHAEQLSVEFPEQAAAAFQHAIAQSSLDPDVRELLTACLARVLFRHGDTAEAEATWVAVRTTDARLRAEMRWMIAVERQRRGENADPRNPVGQERPDDAETGPWPNVDQLLTWHLSALAGSGRAGT
ncbi:MAG: hypothetical protein QOC94_1119 [Actinoplanes sp.]|nr:hypothetical protein [Actinoplanes sp.]